MQLYLLSLLKIGYSNGAGLANRAVASHLLTQVGSECLARLGFYTRSLFHHA
jgi:hypothetical protein